MESLSQEPISPSNLDYFTLLLLRPIAALLFSLSILFIGWLLAWKLVLVHVPLVQEIFGLRKKPVRPKPAGRRRFTQFYNRINAQNPSSEWFEASDRWSQAGDQNVAVEASALQQLV